MASRGGLQQACAMTLRQLLIPVHRWLSLAAMLFWSVQALTGALIVFHWEIDDATIAAPPRATDLAAIGRRLGALAPAGSGRAISSVWTSAGAPDRWDVSLDDARRGDSLALRIDGQGRILRARRDGERIADGGWIDTLVGIHQRLLSGDVGEWLVGTSGVLLLSNLLLGLVVAWPRRWRRALAPPRAGPLPARLHGWHRAIGLWAVLPALAIVSTGVISVFSGGFERLIGATTPAVPAIVTHGPDRPFAQIVGAALARHPAARLSGVSFPGAGEATYRVTLLQPGEPRRAYGTTTVLVRRDTAGVVADDDARAAAPARRIAALVFPLHTGELGGIAGRIAVLLIGLWLLSMIVIGASLWWVRPRRRTK